MFAFWAALICSDNSNRHIQALSRFASNGGRKAGAIVIRDGGHARSFAR
jgi:hypothetical protein